MNGLDDAQLSGLKGLDYSRVKLPTGLHVAWDDEYCGVVLRMSSGVCVTTWTKGSYWHNVQAAALPSYDHVSVGLAVDAINAFIKDQLAPKPLNLMQLANTTRVNVDVTKTLDPRSFGDIERWANTFDAQVSIAFDARPSSPHQGTWGIIIEDKWTTLRASLVPKERGDVVANKIVFQTLGEMMGQLRRIRGIVNR